MLYFKKADLAKTYHVSEKTVTNWMKEARNGKLDLELHEVHDRAWIANTARNIELIGQLVESRKKYRNNLTIKTVAPKSEFYELFTQPQIFDIASNLDIHREIPFQYGYFDGGADLWDKYAQRLASEKIPNFLTSTIGQLRTNQDYIDYLTGRYKQVNIIDIGPGNVMPLRPLLQHLLNEKRLGRYVAIDISPTMLQIAKRNITKWFGDSVPCDTYTADINYDRFTDLLSEYTVGECAENTVNVVFALGGTLANLRNPNGAFKIIHDSMNRNDLFIYNLKLDTTSSRAYFDFDTHHSTPALNVKSKMILDLLNIDESFYDVEIGYDAERKERYMRVRLKVELKLKFVFEKGERTLQFNKNETILMWRFWHQDVRDVIGQLHQNDLDVLQSSLTEDREYLLTISRVKSER